MTSAGASNDAALDVPADVLLDRDRSWLEFNRRVLHEVVDPRTPLLERVKFLAIFGTNLDEFFMKRVARLKRKLAHSVLDATSVAKPAPELTKLREMIVEMLALQADAFTRVIRPELAKSGVDLLEWDELGEAQRRAAGEYFKKSVFAVLTPLAVDPGHPFPFLSNLSTSLGITLRTPGSDERLFARVKVPDAFPQWVPLPVDPHEASSHPRAAFVRLYDVIRNHLGDLFPGMEVLEAMPFRITRNIDVELEDEEPENLVDLVQEGLRMRRLEKAVRLEYGHPASPTQLTMLLRKLDLSEIDAYEMPAELTFTGMMPLASLPRPELRDPPWTPVVPAEFADEDVNVFSIIRKSDVLVQHPYESFDATTAKFIRAAAEDPKVLALKMTVYRVGSDTHFVDALVRAAESGKQVACLVEVTARMDERQNLQFAKVLEKVGVHVVYGVMGLKTHCKTTLVVREDDDGIRCYAHIGTGNYHVRTAKLYTDLGFFTCDPVLTADVTDLFHYLTGRSRKRDYSKLLVAPVNMRGRFLEMIQREAANSAAGKPARIVAKMNQLEDEEIVRALIRASQAGVSIDLVVRGICTLRPGVRGITDNIRVTSIVGRFLEHSRIYYFQNGDEDPLAGSYFIGSADWMTRNLSERVEAVAPIEARPLKARLWEILKVALEDRRLAWDLGPDGVYTQRRPDADTPRESALGTQQTFMELAKQREELL